MTDDIGFGPNVRYTTEDVDENISIKNSTPPASSAITLYRDVTLGMPSYSISDILFSYLI